MENLLIFYCHNQFYLTGDQIYQKKILKVFHVMVSISKKYQDKGMEEKEWETLR